MAVIALCSAAGSPGVTTTAVALAMNWPRPVLLIEADPTGASGILAGILGGQVLYETGLIELALSALDIKDALRDVVRALAPDVDYVAGIRSHQQAGALRDLWEPLAVALAELDSQGQDVIVDAGRLGMSGSPLPLLERADLTLLLTRTNLPALSAARSWVESVRDPTTGWRHAGLLLIGEGDPYTAREVTKVLGLPVVAALFDDATPAAVYHRGGEPDRHFASSSYFRSVAATVEAIQAQLARSQFTLIAGTEPQAAHR